MNRTIREIPGFLTVRGASERLGLAARSVRDLIYAGRLPSQRLGRLHYLHVADVEIERRRRLGLPLPPLRRPAARARRAALPGEVRPRNVVDHPAAQAGAASRQHRVGDARARRERAEQRAQLLERWLRSGHHPATPRLPFDVREAPAAVACDVCDRRISQGRRLVEAAPTDGRAAARLCLTCARRALLAWADERRREAAAARQLAGSLGLVEPLYPRPANAAA